MKKVIPDGVAILLFVLISFLYFLPSVMDGRILIDHDASAGVGAGQEAKEYYEENGERTRWTNSLFGWYWVSSLAHASAIAGSTSGTMLPIPHSHATAK